MSILIEPPDEAATSSAKRSTTLACGRPSPPYHATRNVTAPSGRGLPALSIAGSVGRTPPPFALESPVCDTAGDDAQPDPSVNATSATSAVERVSVRGRCCRPVMDGILLPFEHLQR